MENRTPGYYWIKKMDMWWIGYFAGRAWKNFGFNAGHFEDSFFEEINETRILSPDGR